MKLRKPWMIKLAAWFIAGVLRLWMRTVRCRFNSQGQLTVVSDPAIREHFIYAFWHDSFLCVGRVRSRLPAAALISQSRDGELLATVAQRLGLGTIRGSSTRGGGDAMDEAMEAAKRGHIAVAPDGPQGPRHQVKRGIIYLASWTGLRIVPIGVGFSNAWSARSWDRTSIPKPGSTITLVAGPIVSVPQGIHKSGVERYRRLLEETMGTASAAAQQWAEKGRLDAIEWPRLPAQAA